MELVSVQGDHSENSVDSEVEEDRALLRRLGIQTFDLGYDDQPFDAIPFVDTAAICQVVDDVVCVDSSVGHLAGALGCRVQLLLDCASDWRWMKERTDSPWYPNTTLIRREKAEDWSSVLERVLRGWRQA